MISPEIASSSTLIGNTLVSPEPGTPLRPLAAANAERLQAAAPPSAAASPSTLRVRLVRLWPALMLWLIGTALLTLLNLASRVLAS
ncbi:hypothetical protein [Achromobacter sp. NCFB-sbj8-Ac1-l]|uniref:hypothetical protein n=1 Tax=unclassified Achromobacter TaxID=2626865 RepID=UPI004046B787